jgi:outer membrane scaffolding protein for murein synthesis (MipA/OmpV family)
MKRMIAMTVLALGLAASMPAVSSAADVELSADVLSAYVWRGQVLNDEAVLQPAMSASKNGFAVSWWGNFNLTDNVTGDEYEFSEHDIGVSYSMICPFTKAELTAGVVSYDFPNVAAEDGVGAEALVNNTYEVYLSAAFNEVLLAPTLNVSYDFKEADGLYASLAISHSVEVAEKVAIEGSVSLGFADSAYNEFYFGADDDALNDATFNISIPLAVNDALSISPTVSYAMFLDSDIEDGAEAIYGEKDYVYGGVSIDYTF